MWPSLFWYATRRRLVVSDVSVQPVWRFFKSQGVQKNAGNTPVRSYIGNAVGVDWLSENVMLANRISGAWSRGRRGRKSSCLRGCFEMSVTNYQSTLCNIPEERISHLHCGGGLESRITVWCLVDRPTNRPTDRPTGWPSDNHVYWPTRCVKLPYRL